MLLSVTIFLAQASEQCLTLNGILLSVAMSAGRDLPFTGTSLLKCCGSEAPLLLSSPGKHRLSSSSFQLHESGVICELARVLHNGDGGALPAMGDGALSGGGGGGEAMKASPTRTWRSCCLQLRYKYRDAEYKQIRL